MRKFIILDGSRLEQTLKHAREDEESKLGKIADRARRLLGQEGEK